MNCVAKMVYRRSNVQTSPEGIPSFVFKWRLKLDATSVSVYHSKSQRQAQRYIFELEARSKSKKHGKWYVLDEIDEGGRACVLAAMGSPPRVLELTCSCRPQLPCSLSDSLIS